MAQDADEAIHLFFEDEDGRLRHSEEYFELKSDFGGRMPMIGDLILYPGVSTTGDRADAASPDKRTFYEVTRRIFAPSAVRGWTGLVVRSRQGRTEEAAYLNVEP
jgi:hypothetical protein